MSNFDFEFTENKLSQIITNNQYVNDWFEALSKLLPDYDINTVPRVAAFLAQTAHESGGYKALKENLNYSLPLESGGSEAKKIFGEKGKNGIIFINTKWQEKN